MSIKWHSEARQGFVGVDKSHSTVMQIIPVEYGWDVWVLDLYCGTYLTKEMAQGAALGLYRIAIHGSAIERWQYGTIKGGEK